MMNLILLWEQNSALAELLAQGLGVSTGKLREMGAAGKITAENILPTLIAATDETSATVADMKCNYCSSCYKPKNTIYNFSR